MAMTDPTDPTFDLAAWEAAQQRGWTRDAEERRRRNAAWREDRRTRRHAKNGPGLAPSYVSVPVPDPAPGEPVSAMVRDPRR